MGKRRSIISKYKNIVKNTVDYLKIYIILIIRNYIN